MYIASVKSGSVEILKLKIPENANEVHYGQYLDYLFQADALREFIAESMEKQIDYEYQYIIKLAKAVSVIYNIDYNILLQLRHNELLWLNEAWIRIEKIITEYKPKPVTEVEINGTYYKVPEITQSIFSTTNNLPFLTLQQTVEMAECERVLAQQLKYIDNTEKDEEKKPINKGQVVFNQMLKIFALVTTDHKHIPTDHTFDLWCEQKQVELSKISMSSALDLIFFLSGYGNELETLIGLNIILNRLKLESTEAKTENNIATA